MFIAHLPAGYLLTRWLIRGEPAPRYKRLMAAGLVASVLPDLDLLYFYFIDGRRVPHHDYLTHTPGLWLALAAVAGGILLLANRRSGIKYVLVVLCGVLLHLALDSIASGIRWFYPFSSASLNLVQVPALYTPWVLNFVLHWTFALELGLVAVAAVVWGRANRQRTPDSLE